MRTRKRTAIILAAALVISALTPDIHVILSAGVPAVAMGATREEAETVMSSITFSEWEAVRQVNAVRINNGRYPLSVSAPVHTVVLPLQIQPAFLPMW